MLAVPEVDDDLASASSPEPSQPPETDEEKGLNNSADPPRSRLGLFHRSAESTASRHHSAPPSHQPAPRTGLDAINENVESPPQSEVTQRFSHPAAYATVRRTVSSNGYSYYTEFEPISPSHQYVPRPVEVLKPTFLIVPKATEQRLSAQLSASSSPSKKSSLMSKRHVGLLATPNPSPYVYFGHSSRSDPPTTHDEWTQTLPTDLASPVSLDEQLKMPDELSEVSLDFAQVELPGSWRYRSVPLRTVGRRSRAPLPQAFLDSQHYASDSEQVIHSSISRQQHFGSIPTISSPIQYAYAPSIRLNESDVLKIAAFYRSMGTLVYVARSLATLYSSDFDDMANLKDWKKLYTGVPIWLFNTGMNPKRVRCIRLIISELGSSFTLWDTIVNGASDVRLPKSRHLTLKSLETGTILALKFDETSATEEFHQYFVKFSSDPRNADLFDLFNGKRRRPTTFLLRKRKIKKSAISKPSKFNHINKVDEHDRESLYTFSVLVDELISST